METEDNFENVNLIDFTPEMWGEVTKFRRFYRSTYSLNHATTSALNGVEGHFLKYSALMKLTTEMIPKLAEDKEEAYKNGYSICLRSQQLAAIVETVICELYSAVDCTRRVLNGIYGNLPGINVKSTHKLFVNAEMGKIDERVPVEIRNALINANKDWYPHLQKIRVTINHSDVGSCGFPDGNKISYLHSDLGKNPGNVIVSDDIFKDVHNYYTKVNKFLGVVFKSLNDTLTDELTNQICGIFGGRAYRRVVSAHEAIDFNSGLCESYKWFEQESNPTCPFVKTCGAYLRIKEKKDIDDQAT